MEGCISCTRNPLFCDICEIDYLLINLPDEDFGYCVSEEQFNTCS